MARQLATTYKVPGDEELLTSEDVAVRLRVSLDTARECMHKMPCLVLPSGRRRIKAQDLERWIIENTELPTLTMAEYRARQKAAKAAEMAQAAKYKQTPSIYRPDGKIKSLQELRADGILPPAKQT